MSKTTGLKFYLHESNTIFIEASSLLTYLKDKDNEILPDIEKMLHNYQMVMQGLPMDNGISHTQIEIPGTYFPKDFDDLKPPF